jgi:hypothetical protein
LVDRAEDHEISARADGIDNFLEFVDADIRAPAGDDRLDTRQIRAAGQKRRCDPLRPEQPIGVSDGEAGVFDVLDPQELGGHRGRRVSRGRERGRTQQRGGGNGKPASRERAAGLGRVRTHLALPVAPCPSKHLRRKMPRGPSPNYQEEGSDACP